MSKRLNLLLVTGGEKLALNLIPPAHHDRVLYAYTFTA
jgi:hypothetical protein